MNNQTIKNDPADRSDEAKIELEKQLIAIWQGWQGGNRTFEDYLDCEIEEIRQILDGEDYVEC